MADAYETEEKIESNALLFVKFTMVAQHIQIDNRSRKKFIAQLDLSQIGGQNHTIKALLIIQMLVLNLNYRKPAKISFVKQVVNKEKIVLL